MSARIEDVLAEHREAWGYFDEGLGKWLNYGDCACGERTADSAATYRTHVAAVLQDAGLGDVELARKDAAAEVSAGRDAFLASPGLDPAWTAGWHAATDHHAYRLEKRAEDSPAPVGIGDGGARPEAGGEASSPGVGVPDMLEALAKSIERAREDRRAVELPAITEGDCEECGETVRHSACDHGKDMCPGCWPGLCHGCQADSAECGDATKVGDVP